MDATTLFLLRLCGPVLLVVGLSILLNAAAYKKILTELAGGFSVIYYLVAVIPLSIGMAMVLTHNRWGSTPEILVSLFGWGALIKGVVRLLIPDVTKKVHAYFAKRSLATWAVVVIVWGGAMIWFGYFSLS